MGLELLLAQDYQSAYSIALELNRLNSQRQYKTNQIFKSAIDMVENDFLS